MEGEDGVSVGASVAIPIEIVSVPGQLPGKSASTVKVSGPLIKKVSVLVAETV